MIIEFIVAYRHYTPSQSMDTTSLSPTEWESNNAEVAKGFSHLKICESLWYTHL